MLERTAFRLSAPNAASGTGATFIREPAWCSDAHSRNNVRTRRSTQTRSAALHNVRTLIVRCFVRALVRFPGRTSAFYRNNVHARTRPIAFDLSPISQTLNYASSLSSSSSYPLRFIRFSSITGAYTYVICTQRVVLLVPSQAKIADWIHSAVLTTLMTRR